MRKGQCFLYYFSKDNFKGYFYTGLQDEGNYVFCEMVSADKIDPKTSFMKLSEEKWNEGINNGTIELI